MIDSKGISRWLKENYITVMAIFVTLEVVLLFGLVCGAYEKSKEAIGISRRAKLVFTEFAVGIRREASVVMQNLAWQLHLADMKYMVDEQARLERQRLKYIYNPFDNKVYHIDKHGNISGGLQPAFDAGWNEVDYGQ